MSNSPTHILCAFMMHKTTRVLKGNELRIITALCSSRPGTPSLIGFEKTLHIAASVTVRSWLRTYGVGPFLKEEQKPTRLSLGGISAASHVKKSGIFITLGEAKIFSDLWRGHSAGWMQRHGWEKVLVFTPLLWLWPRLHQSLLV